MMVTARSTGADTGYAATVTITGPSYPGGQAFPTAPDGTYSIGGLMPGSYDVAVSGLPAGATRTEGAADHTIVVDSGGTDNSADFGFWTPATIGDFVFDDLNGDGVQDPGEPGLAGVTLELSGPGVAPGTTVTTGASGAYDFTGLEPGTYTVSVTGTPADAVNTFGGSSQTITVASGEAADTIDFGYYTPGSIGDFVWDDLDGNGLQDDGPATTVGLANVTLTLTGTTASGPITPVTIDTDTNGAYDFDGLAPGTYTVTLDTTDLTTGATSTTGGFTIASIVVTSGTDTIGADFGVAAPATLGDLVFEDVNGNGVFEPGTDGLFEGVTVTVTGTSAGASFPGGTTVTTGTTAGGDPGEYTIGGLLPGTYSVTVTPGTGDLAVDAAASTGSDTQTVALSSGETDLSLDFGYSLPASIGDQLFVDNDADGVFNAGDVGVADVDVVLTGPGLPPTGATISTDASGVYGFSDLALGTYTVAIDTSDPDYVAAFGALVVSSTGGDSVTVTVASADHIDTVDFGWYEPASLGDFVWDDLDGDGVQDPGEPGLEGVTVTLSGGDLAGPITATTGTGASAGAYSFSGLTPGDYTVAIDTADLPNASYVSSTGGDSVRTSRSRRARTTTPSTSVGTSRLRSATSCGMTSMVTACRIPASPASKASPSPCRVAIWLGRSPRRPAPARAPAPIPSAASPPATTPSLSTPPTCRTLRTCRAPVATARTSRSRRARTTTRSTSATPLLQVSVTQSLMI